ncbi:TPA: 4-hydroxythreonine-4-phosphate dehydrogenase, partial [Campylobacter upsaliensis]|nr:4-hydroxythreonine-4-phosphate dehydrogenase [Campylobacter upsaliensis]
MKVAISIGDLNGISLELVLKSHKKLSQICTPYYFLHESLLKQGLNLLKKKEIALNLVEFSHAKISKFEK